MIITYEREKGNGAMRSIKRDMILIVGTILLGLLIRDFSYRTEVKKSYYGTLYAEENMELEELESGIIAMTGTVTQSNRDGRKLRGTFDFELGDCIGQAAFASHGNYYRKELKWYSAVMTSDVWPDGSFNTSPIEIGEYTCDMLYFSKDLSSLGMFLEYKGEQFLLVAAEEKEGLPEAEEAVLESLRRDMELGLENIRGRRGVCV